MSAKVENIRAKIISKRLNKSCAAASEFATMDAAPIQAELATLRELVATLKAALELSRQESKLLRQKIDSLIRRVFGASSEKPDRAQLELLLQLPAWAETTGPVAVVAEPKTSVTRARKECAPRLPENLPVVEEVIEPEPVKASPEQWRCMGQEVSEQLDYEPARFLRRRTIRKKYVSRTELDWAPVIAPLPERLQDRSLPAPGLLAQVVVGKYCDPLPLYRQEQIFRRRHQVHLPRQTLARWVGLVADWLKPIYEQIRTGVMGGGYVQVDETPIRYLDPGNGQTSQGYLWVGSQPKGDVFFHWETSRAAASLDQMVPARFTGIIQCDGYAGYRSFVNDRSLEIILAGCWAHVRRKFFEAIETSPKIAGRILRQIQLLYAVESSLREQQAGPAMRAATRWQQSRPLVERLQRVFLKLKTSWRHLPQSPLTNQQIHEVTPEAWAKSKQSLAIQTVS
jgi:transposase